MDDSTEGNADMANSGFASTRDDWEDEAVEQPFGRAECGEFDWEVRVRLDERKQERERLARELHDSLLQGVLGLSLQLQAAAEKLPATDPSRTALDHAVGRMQRVIEEARNILSGLRSPLMDSMSLEQALLCLGDQFSPGGTRFRVFVTGRPKSLKPAIQEQIYLIGREALINALRHSEATSIETEVEYRSRWLRILVRDNGCGIDPKTVQTGRHAHWGLAGMRERAAGIGAELRIRSRPGCGTEVEIWVPIRT